MKDENKKLTESKQETEDAFVQLKIRYDELRDLNVKHVQVRFSVWKERLPFFPIITYHNVQYPN